jgi:KipI family sensor histidine kinase inhibitor
MTPRILSAGDRALLVQADDLESTLTAAFQLRQARLPQVEDLVPAAETVLVRVAGGTDLTELGDRILELISGGDTGTAGGTTGDPLLIPVHYDGPDLSDVAGATGLSVAEVITAHTGTVWRAAFVGFAPGFAYLAGGDERLQVPRRTESRTSVPAGSVALAGQFSAVYPRRSPGGWQLIGRTSATLWDVTAEPPAAIQPGGWVRFVDADATADTDLSGTGNHADARSVVGTGAMAGGTS